MHLSLKDLGRLAYMSCPQLFPKVLKAYMPSYHIPKRLGNVLDAQYPSNLYVESQLNGAHQAKLVEFT